MKMGREEPEVKKIEFTIIQLDVRIFTLRWAFP